MKLGSLIQPSRPLHLRVSLVALEEVGEPAAGIELPKLRGQTVPGARHPPTAAVAARDDAGQHSWSNARGKLAASSRRAISRTGVSQEKSA